MNAMRRLTVALLATCFLLVGTACGGGSSDSASKPVDVALYAGAVCTALSVWDQQLESASAVLAQRTNTENDLTKVRAEFISFFGGAIDETDGMLADIEAAGVPDVDNGEKVAAAVLKSLRVFRPILVEARAKAKTLPVDDEQLFTTQTQTLGTRFGFERSGLATLFEAVGEQYKTPELTRAANADATCRAL